MKIIFIADFFLEEVAGGGELCTEQIIQYFIKLNIEIEKIKSSNVSVQYLSKNNQNIFFVSNFIGLSENVKLFFIQNNLNYVIIEHDHKYCKTRNPSVYQNLVVPENDIVNRDFFKNARAVLAQSKKHCELIQQNLWIDNVISLGCNLWSDEHIDFMESSLNNKKTIKYAVLNTNNPIKGMHEALEYCRINKIEPALISEPNPKKFIELLSSVETLIFLPQSFETYSRLIVEAKILNCKLITNKSSGVIYEDYISKSGKELSEIVKSKKTEILENIRQLIVFNKNNFYSNFKKPKVSIVTTIYKSKKFIESFMEQFKSLEEFSENELIIVDADSPDGEENIIKKYTDIYKNIKYFRIPHCNTSQALNYAIKNSCGEFISLCFVDDKMNPAHSRILSKNLLMNKNVDLVYGNVFVGNKNNESFKNNCNYPLFEHSLNHFTKENMIKCLPGPMPMFRRTMFEKNNGFNEEMNFANDWDLWLRCVISGSNFKKVDSTVGLYYNNPDGNSTSQDDSKKLIRQKEEKEVFFKYKEVFGDKMFKTFKSYFESL